MKSWRTIEMKILVCSTKWNSNNSWEPFLLKTQKVNMVCTWAVRAPIVNICILGALVFPSLLFHLLPLSSLCFSNFAPFSRENHERNKAKAWNLIAETREMGDADCNSCAKTICSICYEDLKPIVEDLQVITICGHVFHELWYLSLSPLHIYIDIMYYCFL